jgi:hypothetical protein
MKIVLTLWRSWELLDCEIFNVHQKVQQSSLIVFLLFIEILFCSDSILITAVITYLDDLFHDILYFDHL